MHGTMNIKRKLTMQALQWTGTTATNVNMQYSAWPEAIMLICFVVASCKL